MTSYPQFTTWSSLGDFLNGVIGSVKFNAEPLVSDSVYGFGYYSIQLNVSSKNGYLFQNIIQVQSAAPAIPNGIAILSHSEIWLNGRQIFVTPIKFLYKGTAKILFAWLSLGALSSISFYHALSINLSDGTQVWPSYVVLPYSDNLTFSNLRIAGINNGSFAIFTKADFEFYLSLNGNLRSIQAGIPVYLNTMGWVTPSSVEGSNLSYNVDIVGLESHATSKI